VFLKERESERGGWGGEGEESKRAGQGERERGERRGERDGGGAEGWGGRRGFLSHFLYPFDCFSLFVSFYFDFSLSLFL